MTNDFKSTRKFQHTPPSESSRSKRARCHQRKQSVQVFEHESWLFKVTYGGRWEQMPSGDVEYLNGRTAWIHVNERKEFTFGDLMRVVMGRMTGALPAGCFWFATNGCKLPEGLAPLENRRDMGLLYIAGVLNKHALSEIYVQESHVHYSTIPPYELTYELPAAIPKMNSTKRHSWFQLSKMILQIEVVEGKNGLVESNWYVSDSSSENKDGAKSMGTTSPTNIESRKQTSAPVHSDSNIYSNTVLCHYNKQAIEDCDWNDLNDPCRRFLRCPQFKLPSGCSFKKFTDEGLSPHYKAIINDLLYRRKLKAKEIETLKKCEQKFEAKLRLNNMRWAHRMTTAHRQPPIVSPPGAQKNRANHHEGVSDGK